MANSGFLSLNFCRNGYTKLTAGGDRQDLSVAGRQRIRKFAAGPLLDRLRRDLAGCGERARQPVYMM
jgi:hypothetical protein